MKYTPKLSFAVLLLLFFNISVFSQAQNREWNFEVGVSAVDWIISQDVKTIFNDLLGSSDYRSNISPIRFSAEKILTDKSSFQLAVTLNKVKTVRTINDSDDSYFAIDASYKHYVDHIIPEDLFRPYLIIGGSYQRRTNNDFVFHIGGGAQFWFSDTIGLNFQSMYKDNFQLTGAGHYQHSLGIIFKSIPGGSRSTKRIWEFNN